jgi:hypothetical protein
MPRTAIISVDGHVMASRTGCQQDSKSRLETLESVGYVAEVLFPQGQRFQAHRLDDVARVIDHKLAAGGRRACNRPSSTEWASRSRASWLRAPHD